MHDQDFNDDITNINEKLQHFCNGNGLSFIVNNNIDRSCLNKGKLDLNRRGSSYLANSFKKLVSSLWKFEPEAKVCQNTHEHPKVSLDELKSLRIHNHNNIIVSYLNINSIRNKFVDLKQIIDKNVDILYSYCRNRYWWEIDESFPTAQFILPGYHKPYRLNISDKQGGLLVYIKFHLHSRLLLSHNAPSDFHLKKFHLKLI